MGTRIIGDDSTRIWLWQVVAYNIIIIFLKRRGEHGSSYD